MRESGSRYTHSIQICTIYTSANRKLWEMHEMMMKKAYQRTKKKVRRDKWRKKDRTHTQTTKRESWEFLPQVSLECSCSFRSLLFFSKEAFDGQSPSPPSFSEALLGYETPLTPLTTRRTEKNFSWCFFLVVPLLLSLLLRQLTQDKNRPLSSLWLVLWVSPKKISFLFRLFFSALQALLSKQRDYILMSSCNGNALQVAWHNF